MGNIKGMSVNDPRKTPNHSFPDQVSQGNSRKGKNKKNYSNTRLKQRVITDKHNPESYEESPAIQTKTNVNPQERQGQHSIGDHGQSEILSSPK